MQRLETHPLPAMTLDDAVALQWRLVDLIHRHFEGHETLQAGDRGVVPGLGRPKTTAAVERVLAELFGAEDAALVRGAGTGAIRSALAAMVRPGDRVLVHRAPIYPTTRATFEAMGLTPVEADFHDTAELTGAAHRVDAALVQYSRQRLTDSYDLGEVVSVLHRQRADLPVLTDDNYAVLKVPRIGVQQGATASAFSLFKLLGPEGVGCVLGRGDVVSHIRTHAYSGGTQVQGTEAMEALRGLVYAPVSLALQAKVVEEVVSRLNAGEVPGVAQAAVASAQSRVALVQLSEAVAARVLEEAPRFGAARYPVGAESRYEVAAMFYRVSATYLADAPEMAPYLIRVNPMRAGADTVLRVLRQALSVVQE